MLRRAPIWGPPLPSRARPAFRPSYDGTNFWVADYSGTKNAYLVSPSGTLMRTIVLANCTSFCDGLEFFNGKLISNRGDTVNPATYDIYDLNGTVITTAFIVDTG